MPIFILCDVKLPFSVRDKKLVLRVNDTCLNGVRVTELAVGTHGRAEAHIVLLKLAILCQDGVAFDTEQPKQKRNGPTRTCIEVAEIDDLVVAALAVHAEVEDVHAPAELGLLRETRVRERSVKQQVLLLHPGTQRFTWFSGV